MRAFVNNHPLKIQNPFRILNLKGFYNNMDSDFFRMTINTACKDLRNICV